MSQKQIEVCQRTACDHPLERGRYRIWNNPTAYPDYREYCIPCGRKIVEYTPTLKHEIK